MYNGLGSFVNCYASACCPILLPIVFAPVMGMDDRKIVFFATDYKANATNEKPRFCVNVSPLSAHLNMTVIISSRSLQRPRTPPEF